MPLQRSPIHASKRNPKPEIILPRVPVIYGQLLFDLVFLFAGQTCPVGLAIGLNVLLSVLRG